MVTDDPLFWATLFNLACGVHATLRGKFIWTILFITTSTLGVAKLMAGK